MATSSLFAQYDGQTDCGFIGNSDPGLYAQAVVKAIEKTDKPQLQIYTNDDMGVALSHMKQYCCSANLLAEEACSWVDRAKPYHPQSPYIFDHLMYVGMKKMDGIQEDCDILWISCEPREYQIKPVEWRDKINEIGRDTKWYPPGQIMNTYTEYRWDKESYGDKSTPTMLKAYERMCKDAVSIRYAVWVPETVSNDYKQNTDSLALLCEITVQERRAREAAYVRTLQVEKWTKFVVDNLKAYLNEYFINKRMADLVWKYWEMDACFSMVSRYVEKTSQCNQ